MRCMNPTVAASPPASEAETRAEIDNFLAQTRHLSEETRAIQAQIHESQRRTSERLSEIRSTLIR